MYFSEGLLSNCDYWRPRPKKLVELIDFLDERNISIFDCVLCIDNSNDMISINSISDYEPYLLFNTFSMIQNATFDDITYNNVIRILTPTAIDVNDKA